MSATSTLSLAVLLPLSLLAKPAICSQPPTFVFRASPPATWSSPQDVFVQDTLAFVAMYHGVIILDATSPSDPSLLGGVYLSEGPLTDIEVDGSNVYATLWGPVNYSSSWPGAFYSIDASDPENPLVADVWSTPAYTHGVDIRDGVAYVVYGHVRGEEGLLILDVADPFKIGLIGQLPMDFYNTVDKVMVMGDYAYIAGIYMHVIDVSDLPQPVLVNQLSDSEFIPVNLDARQGDSLLYVAHMDLAWPASTSAMTIYSIARPDTLQEVGQVIFTARVLDVDLYDSTVFVCNSTCGFKTVDVRSPGAPAMIDEYHVAGSAIAADVANNLAFVVDGGSPSSIDIEDRCLWQDQDRGPHERDLYVLDVSDPADMQLAGYLPFPGPVTGVVARGSVAVTLNSEHVDSLSPGSDLMIFDVSTIEQPVLRGLYLTEGAGVAGAFIDDTLLLLATGQSEVEIINVANPAAPSLASVLALPGNSNDVVISGDVGVVGTDAGISLVDLSDPAYPTVIHDINPQYPVLSVCMEWPVVYAVLYARGIVAYDIRDPGTPQLTYTYLGTSYWQVETEWNRLYALYGSGFSMFDISLPATPTFLKHYPNVWPAWSIEPFQDFVLVGAELKGVHLIDVSDTANMFEIARYDTPGIVSAMNFDDGRLFVADMYGLVIFELDNQVDVEPEPEPSPPVPDVILEPGYPNPFNAGTTITYQLSRRMMVDVSVCDVLGRTVATLSSSLEGPGLHRVSWSGLDSRGRTVASGVYFCRIRTAGATYTQKLVLLR